MSSEHLISYHRDAMRAKLEDDAIIVAPQAEAAFQEPASGVYKCFGTNEPQSHNHYIPYNNILWCKLACEDEYEITYVSPHKHTIEIRAINLKLDHGVLQSIAKDTADLSETVLKKAYADSISAPSILILINPHGGRGNAKEIFEKEIMPVLRAAHAKVVFEETKYHGHATEIARDLDVDDYDIVACCSGDGVPHEVINGFYAREDKGVEAFNKIAITQLPGGSGNALTLSTHGSNDAKLAVFKMLKSQKGKIDLMALKQEDDEGFEKVSLSFLSQCYGAIADADIGTEHLRWMGPIRFDLGVVHKVLTGTKYPCDLYLKRLTKTKRDVTDHFNRFSENSPSFNKTQVTTAQLELKGPKIRDPVPDDWEKIDPHVSDNVSIFYVGNMPYVSNDTQFFPAALPNDGSMDMVLTTTHTPIIRTASILLSVDKGQHVHDDSTIHTKVAAYRLVPKLPVTSTHYLSIDGESFPFKPFQVEILPGIMTGLLTKGNYVETCFTAKRA